MRSAFVDELCAMAAERDDLYLLTGDLGFNVLDGFARDYPERFINAGIAEQNMTGVAAGLALSGKVAVTYSIANFSTARCLEQIRNDVCYHEADVKIVTVGAGFAYGTQGYTHFGIEDVALLRVLPNIRVYSPGDLVEARLLTRAMIERPGPCYMRLGGKAERIHQEESGLDPHVLIPVRQGRDLTLVATGGSLGDALEAAGLLAERSVSAQVLSAPCLTPFDGAGLLEAARRTGRLVTVEEHGRGGLGTIAAECLAPAGGDIAFRPLYAAEPRTSYTACQASQKELYSLHAQGIADAVLALLKDAA